MQTRLRQIAIAAALSLGASAVTAMPAMAQQDESQRYPHRSSAEAQRTDPDTYANHPDYSNNEYYRTGNGEGYEDYQAKKRREKHEHQYRGDDDRKAHDYGYQEGWSGRRYGDQNSRTGQYGNGQYGSGQSRDRDDRNNGNRQANGNGQYRSGENQKYGDGNTYGQSQSRDRDDAYRSSDTRRNSNNQDGDRERQKHDKDDDRDHDKH